MQIFSHQAIMMEALMNILYNIVLSKNEEIKFIDDDEKECNNTHCYEKLKENKGESLFDEVRFVIFDFQKTYFKEWFTKY